MKKRLILEIINSMGERRGIVLEEKELDEYFKYCDDRHNHSMNMMIKQDEYEGRSFHHR